LRQHAAKHERENELKSGTVVTCEYRYIFEKRRDLRAEYMKGSMGTQ
jgi:hypothetical protein